jgi:hypothetical protein
MKAKNRASKRKQGKTVASQKQDPTLSPFLSAITERRARQLADNQYKVIHAMIEKMVIANLKCDTTEEDCIGYVARFGGEAEESVLVNTWDLVQLARRTSTLLNSAGDTLQVIQRLEHSYGIELYCRNDGLLADAPPTLMQMMLGNEPVGEKKAA